MDEEKDFYEWFDFNKFTFEQLKFSNEDIAYFAWICSSNTKLRKLRNLLKEIIDCTIAKDTEKDINLIMIKNNKLNELKKLYNELKKIYK